MTTLTRSTSRTTPAYKDYVNFLGAYKNGRKEDGENFPLSNSSTASSIDVTDFSKNSCVPFNTYVENAKNKKFNSVKPNLEEKPVKKMEKTEIYIEIQPVKSVSEVSKMFENKEKSPPPKNISSKINVFERQISKEKPKLANKPVLTSRSPPPKVEIELKPPTPPPVTQREDIPPPPPIDLKENNIPPPPPPPAINPVPKKITVSVTSTVSAPPPPPPPPPAINPVSKNMTVPVKSTMSVSPPPPPPATHSVPKLQATLTKGPPVKHSVNNPNGVVSNGIDRNDPMVKKLVYGTLRGLYGAYHDKANDMMATLPQDRVRKSNGVQDIIEKIASSGDLDKLNGRVNPKTEQE